MSFFLIQPKLADYRIRLYEELGKKINDIFVFHEGGLDINETGIENCTAMVIKRINFKYFYIQLGIFNKLISHNPTKIFVFADLKNLTLWLCLFYGIITGNKVFLHGQGVFKKKHVSNVTKFIWGFALRLCYKFIAYNEFVSSEMNIFFPKYRHKICFCSNSLQDENLNRSNDTFEKNYGILFVGRIREGSKLELLLATIVNINKKRLNVGKSLLQLHIIGSGTERNELETKYQNHNFIFWYGMIYEPVTIAKIAQYCSVGIYPGDGGLSIVHYMGMGLYPLVHNDWKSHMGPEPWYVTKLESPITFKRDSQASLESAIDSLFLDESLLYKRRMNARDFFISLNTPDYATRLYNILDDK